MKKKFKFNLDLIRSGMVDPPYFIKFRFYYLK